MVRLKMLYANISLALVAVLTQSALAEDAVDFNRDVRPILSEKCFQCHGPDEATREADLRFDVADDDHGPFQDRDGSTAIKPGDISASTLWHRITTDDEDELMPPKDSHKEPLSAEQRAVLKSWILSGAKYDAFWAFVPPKPQQIPAIKNKHRNANRIDRFVLAKLDKLGRMPQPRADKRTLIRRVTFDLTGLPPTRNEIDRFLQDTTADAYEKLVDRLMASPRYGEHMTKYWLDLVRFADTNGIHHDHYREMTPYRDWVIRSFNHNLPFDQFVVDQIAGDLHEQPTLDQQIASGFNRLHLVIDVGTAIPQESFTRNVIDRVTSVGTAFMGLTVGCAVCHDHKYDPISQRDFYQLYAFFNNIDSTPETPGRNVHAPFVRLPNAEQSRRLTEIENKIQSASQSVRQFKEMLQQVAAENAKDEPVNSPSTERVESTDVKTNDTETNDTETNDTTDNDLKLAKLKEQLADAETELKSLRDSKRHLDSTVPVSLVMKERAEVRPTHILVRGMYDQPGEEVERNTPSFLPPLKAAGDVKTRMDLARWLTDKDHPLTARVTVNRYWQQFFGVGLVKTSEDFGTQGEWPSHPDLLDDLTTNFVDSGWDVKAFVRSIVTSNTYQQSSTASPNDFKTDRENRLLARGSRFRLDAEMIRDQVLAVSGLLHESMYGKSVKPPQPADLWKTVSMVSSSTYAFQADTGKSILRRSLYSFWKRALPPPQMTIFDAPTRESCTARRERTNTPLQALVLMNEEEYFKAAKSFAKQILAKKKMDDRQRLTFAFESVTSRLPDATEIAALESGLISLRKTYQEDAELTKAMTADDSQASDHDRLETAAYTMLVNSLFNLDITKTRE